MKDELDKQLCEKYPEIFRDRHEPPHKTCMYWGLAVGDGWYDILDVLCANIQHHIDQNRETIKHRQEWVNMRAEALRGNMQPLKEYCDHRGVLNEPLYDMLKKQMLEIGTIPPHLQTPEEIPQVVAAQVKEKFGTLRFYYDGGDKYIAGLVAMAEGITARTCETCGAPGKIRTGGWIHVMCDEHEAAYLKERKTR